MNSGWKIFWSSFIAFFILNFFENLLHYNIGRHSNQNEVFDISPPTPKDCIRIFLVMIIFGILQGMFTLFLNKHYM